MNPVINFHKSPSLAMVKVWMKEKGFSVKVDGKTQLEIEKGKTRIVFEHPSNNYTVVTVYDEGRTRKFGDESTKLKYINSI